MIHRQQVFVRALDAEDKWGSADILDLDDESFRAFVIRVLVDAELVCAIKDDCFAEGQPLAARPLQLRLKEGLTYHSERSST